MNPRPEHLPDDIAAADKAVERLLDALSVLRDHDLPAPAVALVRDAQAQALGVWSAIHLDLPKAVKP